MTLRTGFLYLILHIVPGGSSAYAQTLQSAELGLLFEHEQRVEEMVIEGDVAALDTVYAADFYFAHGTGLIQTKAEWLETVQTAHESGVFRSRILRDQEGDLHGNIAVIEGWIDVEATRVYSVHYVRVYEQRAGRWVLLSHRTVGGG